LTVPCAEAALALVAYDGRGHGTTDQRSTLSTW